MEPDTFFMRRALDLARRGEGFVEPNPMVGCVLVRNGKVIGEGYHSRYGARHAEVEAIGEAQRSAPDGAVGACCYVTLEPCSHFGKTAPCTSAIIESGIQRVVVAVRDPNPKVDGRGLKILRNSGLNVIEGPLEAESRQLLAPYLTRLEKGRPWIIAKWAMTLDGKLATRENDSRWISSSSSRNIVHRLRARMDAILVGIGTATVDDPLLTVRTDSSESGLPQRTPLRIVLDSKAMLAPESRLVHTAKETPVLVVVGPTASNDRVQTLQARGCEIVVLDKHHEPAPLFRYLLERGVTNLLVEGGSAVLGDWFDRKLIDDAHVFVAPKLVGGQNAPSPFGAVGFATMQDAASIESPQMDLIETDVYIRGRILRR